MTSANESAAPQEPNAEATKLLLSIARERIAGQEHGWNAHRTKAGFILAASAALTSRLSHDLAEPCLLLLEAIALLVAGSTAIAIIWPRSIVPGVKLKAILQRPVMGSERDLTAYLLTHYIEAVDQNEITLKKIATLSRIALGCLTAALAFFILTALMQR